MSKSKSYNRIVFLTTLSVYLGLVLVGGTAPVLAHSALTKHFDIRNEVEFKDDLDKKPDNEDFENASADDFPALFAELLNEVRQNVESKKILLPENFRYSTELSESLAGYGTSTGPAETQSAFDDIIEKAIRQKFQRKAFELADYVTTSRSAKVNLEAKDQDWSLKISFSKSKAEQFANFLNQQFSTSADSIENASLKRIYENTNSTAENNQVFVVTRLPRASLEASLK